MRKKLLMAIALLVSGVGNLWAQTDVTSTYLTNAGFEGSQTKKVTTKGGDFYEPANWTCSTTPGTSTYHYATTTGAEKSEGDQSFRCRFNWASFSYNISQTLSSMPAGEYSISADIKITKGGGSASISASVKGNSNESSKKTAVTDFTTLTSTTTLSSTGNLIIGLYMNYSYSGSSSSDISCYWDNVKLVYNKNVNGPLLAALIAQARSINTAQGGLTDAISAAQTVYDGIDNTPDYQDDIDDAITTLKSAITTKVAGISMKHNDDLSYLIANAGFEGITAETVNYSTVEGKDYSTDGWMLDTTSDSGQGAVLTYGSGLTVNGATIPASDNNSNSGKALGLSVGWASTQLYKTAPITLPAGKYNLRVYSYNAGTSTPLTSKFGFAPTSGDATLSTKTSYTKDEWGSEEVTIELASATEGCFQLGGVAASGTSGNTAKVFFDNITLTYINELAEAQEQWQDVHDALDALDATALPDAAETAITTELAKSVPTTTVDDVNTAKAALQAFIDNYAGIKAAYDKVNALITLATSEKDNSVGDADAKSTLNTAISTATSNKETRTTADALNGDYSTLETARRTYVTSGAEPDAGYPFDWTFKLSNPSFESGTTGWTLSKETTGSWTYEAESYDPAPVDGVRCLNAWGQQINYIDVYQNITLPMGSYSFKGYLYSTGKKAQHIYAYITSDNSSSNLSSSSAWEQLTANFTQSSSSDTSVKLGIYSKGNNVNNDTYGWFRADNFQLFYNGKKPVLNDLITSATAMTSANVGTGVFQIPSDAASTLSTAITDAQGVYDDDADGDDVQGAINALNEAIETFQAAELVAPEDGKRYKLTLADRGTLTYQTASTEGGYGFPFKTAGDYMAQSFTLTKVSGNTYTISFEDLEGNNRYICTRAQYGEGGTGTAGIRSFVESGDGKKALQVKIQATSTDNVFYMLNTEREDAKLGSNGGDFYTDNAYTSWSIAEATQASVTVSCKAGKYGTVIFPFTPDVSEGFNDITFYSCSSVNGETNKAQLSEVLDAPAANTPYLIKNDDEENFTKILTGWGTASAVSYKPDGSLLTGVFTNASITHDANNYILQTQGGVQAFYLVKDEDFEATAYKAYLTYDAGGGVKAFYLDGDETAVSSVKADELQGATIYNLAGQRVNKAQKGVYIINGKKVAVK